MAEIAKKPGGGSTDGMSNNESVRGWKTRWIAVAALTVLVAGCDYNRYLVEIVPENGGFKRTLTVTRHGTEAEELTDAEDQAEQNGEEADDQRQSEVSLSEEELARIAKLYEVCIEDLDTSRHVFTKQFAGKTPDDVGVADSLTKFDSQMGSLFAYVERFRGNDDQYAVLTERQKGGEQLVELLLGWLDAESPGEARLAELRAFLDGPFRRDVQNLILYIWQFGTDGSHTDGERALGELLARVGQFLVERGYLEPAQFPVFMRAILHTRASEETDLLLRLIRPLVVAKAGLASEAELVELLDFLASPRQVSVSFDRYTRGTEAYRDLLDRHKQEGDVDGTEPPSATDVVMELWVAALPEFKLFDPDDQVEVRLAAQTRPFLTNGEWDKNTSRVV